MKICLPSTTADNIYVLNEISQALINRCKEKSVFLLDADRTLTEDDTSQKFLRIAGIDPQIVKNRFKKDGYVFSAFRYHAQVHLSVSRPIFCHCAQIIADDVLLYNGVIEFLRFAEHKYEVFILTAGIPLIWDKILENIGITNVTVIGGISHDCPFVFGRYEKGIIARMISLVANRVIAVGDSQIDADMLMFASKAVMVLNHKKNIDLLPIIAKHPYLWQIVPKGSPHIGIAEISFPELLGLA